MTEPSQESLKETILCGFDDAELELEGDALDRLTRYGALIQKWNRAIRLVGDAHADQIAFHMVDSAVLLRLPLPKITWVDVGSGAGFPGLVLACLKPEQKILLVEPREKRAIFLGQAIKALGLDNVSVERARLEQTSLPPKTLLMSKALAPPLEFLKMSLQANALFTCVMTNKDGVPSNQGQDWEELARCRHQVPGYATRVNLLYQRRAK